MEDHHDEPAAACDDDIELEEEEDVDWETDEETDKKQFGIYQCLPVDDTEPDWDAGEPDSVEEYLRRVRYEARQLPSIVTSDIDPRTFDDRRTDGYTGPKDRTAQLAECPEEMKSSPEWVRKFLRKFASLRRRLQREDDMLSGRVDGLPLRVIPASPPILDPLTSPSALMPELVELRGLDQVAITRRLYSTVQRVVRGDALNTEDAAQLYALSARMERPLHADSCAAYRSLLRRCCQWIAAVKGGPHDEILPHLSILIALSGAYFGQDENLASLWQAEEEEEAQLMEEESSMLILNRETVP